MCALPPQAASAPISRLHLIADGAALGEESSAALHLFARQGEDLREAQQRNAQLENDNVQLQARVSGAGRCLGAECGSLNTPDTSLVH